MVPRIPLTIGAKYGRLTVTCEEQPRGTQQDRFVRCICDCGETTVVKFAYLRYGHTLSCGCYKREQIKREMARRKESAEGNTPEHRCWLNMRYRCSCPTAREFHLYGGRGIRVCEEWQRSFTVFLRDVGRRPSAKHSLDRIDPNGHYEPKNVRWATTAQQAANKRNTRFIEYNGDRLPLNIWAKTLGIRQSILHRRIVTLGWSPEQAFQTPVQHRHSH